MASFTRIHGPKIRISGIQLEADVENLVAEVNLGQKDKINIIDADVTEEAFWTNTT